MQENESMNIFKKLLCNFYNTFRIRKQSPRKTANDRRKMLRNINIALDIASIAILSTALMPAILPVTILRTYRLYRLSRMLRPVGLILRILRITLRRRY